MPNVPLAVRSRPACVLGTAAHVPEGSVVAGTGLGVSAHGWPRPCSQPGTEDRGAPSCPRALLRGRCPQHHLPSFLPSRTRHHREAGPVLLMRLICVPCKPPCSRSRNRENDQIRSLL